MDDPSIEKQNFSRVLGLVWTIVTLGCLVMRHYFKFVWKKTAFSKDKGVILFYKYKEVTSVEIERYIPHVTTWLTPTFFIEFCAIAMTPIPYYDIYITQKVGSVVFHYLLSEIMIALMATRLLFVIRAWFNYSVYTDIYTKKLC